MDCKCCGEPDAREECGYCGEWVCISCCKDCVGDTCNAMVCTDCEAARDRMCKPCYEKSTSSAVRDGELPTSSAERETEEPEGGAAEAAPTDEG